MNICLGVTLRNKRCKIILKNKKYCNKHKKQEIINEICMIKKELEHITDKLKEISINNEAEKDKIIIPHDNKYVSRYIKKNQLKFNIIDVPGDGNCGFHVILKFLESKNKYYNIPLLKNMLKKINNEYDENEWIEIFEIASILNYFNYGVIFREKSINDIVYYGFNIKKNIYNNCYIDYLKDIHYNLLNIINTN